MPTQPDALPGFMIPMILHGQIVYVSNFYSWIYNLLFWEHFGFFIFAAAIDVHMDPFYRRSLRQ